MNNLIYIIKMKRIEENFELLNLISTCKKNKRDILIKKGKKEFILSICECVLNTLNGNVNFNKTDLEKLQKYKSTLRNLIKKSNIKKKKDILIQKGGFLQILLPTIISGVVSLIQSLVSKKND